MIKLEQAFQKDTNIIVKFLSDMSSELEEFPFDDRVFSESVANSFEEQVHWFLFIDEKNKPFGTCYLQSVHSYWCLEKRFYLGGFYIKPTHRGKGHFKNINELLRDWVKANNGVQIYCHIHKDNEKSLKVFESVDLKEIEYSLCINHWGD